MTMRLAVALAATFAACVNFVVGAILPDATPTTYDDPVVVTQPPLDLVHGTTAQAAQVGVTATRGPQVQVAPTVPPPSTTIPTWTPGDCSSFRPVLAWHGATDEAISFFVDAGILNRETSCGRDLLNERTLDTGPCQINPVHNKPGWFGGREFGPGGWLLELHQLTAGQHPDDPRWIEACLTLYTVCGPGPWRPPYSCEGNRL